MTEHGAELAPKPQTAPSDEIAEPLPAGRELDALVAAKVMGWQPNPGWLTAERHIPSYSTDIAVAWQIAEAMRLAAIPEEEWASGGWRAAQEPFNAPGWYERDVNDWEWAETAPLAICRAALKAVGA